jgi:hypothetical protein
MVRVSYVETGEVKNIIPTETIKLLSLLPAFSPIFTKFDIKDVQIIMFCVLLVKINVGKTLISLRFYTKLYFNVFRKIMWHFKHKKQLSWFVFYVTNPSLPVFPAQKAPSCVLSLSVHKFHFMNYSKYLGKIWNYLRVIISVWRI